MESEKSKNVGIRLLVMLLDYKIITFSIAIIGVVFIGAGIVIYNNLDLKNFSETLFTIITVLFMLCLFSIYLNKDVINGRSPAKRIFGLITVNNKTGERANPIETCLRNITLIFWPVEVIFILISPQRRIGDYIAGTKVIDDKKNTTAKINKKQIAFSIFLGMLFIAFFSLLQMAIFNFDLLTEFIKACL